MYPTVRRMVQSQMRHVDLWQRVFPLQYRFHPVPITTRAFLHIACARSFPTILVVLGVLLPSLVLGSFHPTRQQLPPHHSADIYNYGGGIRRFRLGWRLIVRLVEFQRLRVRMQSAFPRSLDMLLDASLQFGL